MKPLKRILLCICALFTLASTTGVYAVWRYFEPVDSIDRQISVGMNEFNYDPGEILYITAVELYSSRGFATPLQYSSSLPTNIKVSGEVVSRNSSVTYKVTVFNNTDSTYWYMGKKMPSYGSNLLIPSGAIEVQTKEKPTDNGNTFDVNDWIPARTQREIYVTYMFVSDEALKNIDLFINYYFNIKIDGVQDEILKILNDKEGDYGYQYLVEVFNNKYAESGSTVINNVEEEEVFDNLFGEDLMLDVNGTMTPVTISIQRKDVDKTSDGDDYPGANAPKDCEYTIYVTTDPLTAGGKPTVYAISYSCGEDGVWYQLGQLYEGTTSVGNSADGAVIDVGSWIATPKEYQAADGITYKVGQPYGTNYDLLKTMEEIISADDQEIFNKIDNSGLFKKVYDILNTEENKYSEAPEVVNLRRAFESAAPYYEIRNNGQEIKFLRNCTRGEILPYLERLSDALEYYETVHD